MAETDNYIDFDPEALWRSMIYTHVYCGGGALYPGDEKEMLLRTVQVVIEQTLAKINDALRMATLRHATGVYLDMQGENRDCERLSAEAAAGMVDIVLTKGGAPGVLPEGAELTADGTKLYALAEDVPYAGNGETVSAPIVCLEAGVSGNGLPVGTEMWFTRAYAQVARVTLTGETVGGMDEETDEAYRERIRLSGLASVTTGPSSQYETRARAVSSEIIDVKATQNGAGQVLLTVLFDTEGEHEALLQAVRDACDDRLTRPLTDQVTAKEATVLPYTLNIQYRPPTGPSGTLAQDVADAVAEYQTWQDMTIGRAFNPDKLVADIYRAGAERVVISEDSRFNGGDAAYTEIDPTARCKGVIQTAVMGG